MKILAFDTSMQACSAAVLSKDGNGQIDLFQSYEEIERGHAERLMGLIDEVLRNADTNIGQIDRFAVCRGPGTFTGVRIGIAAARGLALACNKPLIGIGTLEVMAARVFHDAHKYAVSPPNALGVAVDARRDEIYWQLFKANGTPVGEPAAQTPQAIAKLLDLHPEPVSLAGSGANLIRNVLATGTDVISCTHPNLQPHAARLSELALRADQTCFSHHQGINPLYLRPADAKIQAGYAVERQ